MGKQPVEREQFEPYEPLSRFTSRGQHRPGPEARGGRVLSAPGESRPT
ncbi:hypothetical protein [Streptomyces chryseus]